MSSIHEDMDETARLILMGECTGLIDFSVQMREVYPNLPLAGDKAMSLYKKYRGFDGRSLPTHDVETGERISTR